MSVTDRRKEEETKVELEKEEDRSLPPRRTVHQTDAGKWTRRFYALLVYLLFALVFLLIGWFYWRYE